MMDICREKPPPPPALFSWVNLNECLHEKNVDPCPEPTPLHGLWLSQLVQVDPTGQAKMFYAG